MMELFVKFYRFQNSQDLQKMVFIKVGCFLIYRVENFYCVDFVEDVFLDYSFKIEIFLVYIINNGYNKQELRL